MYSAMKLKQISWSVFSTVCKRFAHTKPEKCGVDQWVKPTGTKTNINVYNPVAKCKTPLILKNRDFLTWYMCGPTVYDSSHIGHACTYVRFDIIKRILSDVFNIGVIQIMGLTDIDDKIIKKSKETNQDWQQLTQFYEKEFFEDMAELNVANPYHTCRVSEYVPQIIEFVSKIVNKNYGYVVESGSVYFDTLKYQNYGKLSVPEQNLEVSDPEKKSALDFALWKATKEGEPFWESPWGNGRPGWHIECSAIASHIFGNNIDIHSGGIDLSFPHHENEEAQSCCYHDEVQWVNYWLHTGHLYSKDNEKMSKSLKNTISIKSLLEKYTANEFRLLCLMTHYRNGIEFSEVVMKNAVSILKKIEHFLQCCEDYVSGKVYKGNVDDHALMIALNETKSNVLQCLQDDFNTGKAMFEIIDLIGFTNKMFSVDEIQVSAKGVVAVAAVSNYIHSILTKFGIINSKAVQNQQSLNGIVDSYVKFRNIVRNKSLHKNEKDLELLKACDVARKDLSVYGIGIKDLKSTSTWTIVNNKK